MNYLIVAIISLLTLLIVNKIHIIPKFFLIFDSPDKKRKIHTSSVPLLGGIIIYINAIFLISNLIIFSQISFKNYFLLLILSTIFFFIGFFDDKFKTSPLKKTVIIFITVFFIFPFEQDLIVKVLTFKDLSKPIILHQSSIFFTVLCVFFLYNFFNFSDGLNGIAISLIIYYFLIFFIYKSFNSLFLVSLIFSFVILLIYNIKNKIFLGNSGTSLLSILISFIVIESYNNNSSLKCDEIFLLFFVQAIDCIRITLERLFKNKSPFLADNNHLHHLMTRVVDKKFVFIVYIAFSIIPLAITHLGVKTNHSLLLNFILYVLIYFYLKNKK